MSWTFEILNNISDNGTLVQLMYTVGGVNHAVSISMVLIYDSDYEESLSVMK